VLHGKQPEQHYVDNNRLPDRRRDTVVDASGNDEVAHETNGIEERGKED
jgi:hypothetical protein